MDADRTALDDLVARYAVAVDRWDGAAVARLFTADGRMVLHEAGIQRPATRTLSMPEDIGNAIASLRRYVVTMHFVGQHVLDDFSESTDRASGVTYCLANHVYEVEGGRVNRMVALRYFDDYVRLPDGWRFAERRLSFDWVEHRSTSSQGP